MNKALSILALSLSLLTSVWAEEPVNFPDANLKAAVEEALWVSDPTPTDMLGLTDLSKPIDYKRINAVQNLTGLEYAANLQTLNLRYHRVSDLSPLAGLSHLATINLLGNFVSDLSPLASVSHLQTLDLELNQVSDISALANLHSLRSLGLHRNHVSDISPLAGLTSLVWLDLRANPMNQEAFDLYLSQIEANNPGIELLHDGLFEGLLTVSSGPGGYVTRPGEGQFPVQFGAMIWLEARADPYFTFVNWSGSYFTTQNPLLLTIDLDYQVQANFRSTLATIHVDDDAPADPGPGNPAVSDPQENGTTGHPFDRVQEAIDVAADGVTIYVHPGTYNVSVDLRGKTLTFIGFDPGQGGGGEEPIQFLDGKLKAAVELALGISNPTPTDMLGLTTLTAEGKGIADLSGLEYAINLQTLRLRTNRISDISPLAGLISLVLVDLRANALNAQACNTYLPQILANNPGVTLLYDPCGTSRRLRISATAGGSVVRPGEGEFVYEHGAAVLLEARANPGYLFAGFTGTWSSTRNSVSLTMDRDHDIQANFVSAMDRLHVDDDAPADPGPGNSKLSDPQENGTAEHPFDRIQEAIDVAADGVVILVHAGTYRESIDLLGKRVGLTGFDPDNPMKAAWPVIDGGGSTGPVVSFTHGEDPNCVLQGFVITGGKGAGAIRCSGSSPTIINCLIVGNRAMEAGGAAVYCTDSNPVLMNCTIADNYAGRGGAALYLANSRVLVTNSILWNDTPAEILCVGAAGVSIGHSTVAGGWPGAENLTRDPLFARPGYWADLNDPKVVVPPDRPNAVWVMGDYHVQSQAGRWDSTNARWIRDAKMSPCIDAGNPANPVGDEPVPNGGIINMGAYGGTVEASKSNAIGEPVHFGDPILKAAVEQELWTADPTAADMLGLTRLEVSDSSITSLTGLEYAANLDELRLARNQISDISPLSGLSKLRTLDLNNNRIPDIALVATIPNLESVDLHDNHFSDLSPLSSLSKLQTLVVRGNHIRDVCVLPGLSTLRNLDLNMNEISNISCLASMVGLESLDLRNNPLNQQACSVYIPQIVANNPTAQVDPSPCQFRLTLSAGIGGSVISPGEGEFTYLYSQMILLQAQADPHFVFTGWSGTYFSRLNPASLVLDHDYQIQANFQSTLTTIYVDDDGPDDPGPGDSAISDPQENGTVEHPFDSIQEAIDVAANGVTIFVNPGTYGEDVDLHGKTLTFIGFDPG